MSLLYILLEILPNRWESLLVLRRYDICQLDAVAFSERQLDVRRGANAPQPLSPKPETSKLILH